jgi:hypothetical protein
MNMSLKDKIAQIRANLDAGIDTGNVILAPPQKDTTRPALVVEPDTSAPQVKAMADKSAGRDIRKTIFAWFRTMTPVQFKAITKEQFRDKVLSIDPNWAIAIDIKKVSTHLSWYRGAFKKLPPDQQNSSFIPHS